VAKVARVKKAKAQKPNHLFHFPKMLSWWHRHDPAPAGAGAKQEGIQRADKKPHRKHFWGGHGFRRAE